MAPADLSTEQWEDMVKNPDPRVKWAMDIMDQEGEEFTGMVGRAYIPFQFATLPAIFNSAKNALNRVPLRTNLASAILLSPLSLGVGFWYAGWMKRRAAEEEAMMKHYILTHPEHFPEPKKVKYLDKLEPWTPVRV